MNLLLVEDDPRLSQYLVEALGREGYQIEVCTSVEETNVYISSASEPPKVVILDRMLGREDGANLISRFKSQFPKAGILVLSSLDMPSEKARIIDSGADEYLSKPFSLDELSARLRLVIRRATSGTAVDNSLRAYGNLCLDLKSQLATSAGTKLDLTRKEFQLLCLLLEHPGRVFNRFQILDRIWEIERSVESNVVESTIKTLRRKLEESKSNVKIESKRNVGYWVEQTK